MEKKKKFVYICTHRSMPPNKRAFSYVVEKRQDFWSTMETPRKVIDYNGKVEAEQKKPLPDKEKNEARRIDEHGRKKTKNYIF